MTFTGSPGFYHGQQDKIGVLITNLGTPQAPTKQALKPYLKQFLSDPRVVEVPRLLWWFILNGIILNVRPKRSAHAYASVWSEQGSPLLVHTQNQANAIREKLSARYGDNVQVEFAMRYGQPSIESVVDRMLNNGVRKLLVLPLYPQYSASTTGSTFDALAQDFIARRWLPELRFVNQYCDNDDYIQALADKIQAHWESHGRADKLIFSYHGVPKRYLLNGDPYHCQCHKTSRLVAEKLGLSKDEYLTTFQSRFGREEWLKPYTDETLKALPAQGVKSVQVVCPGFSADCLETIEEIGVENRGYFMDAGGQRYEYIEALNADAGHIDALFGLIESNMHGWQVNADAQRAHRAKQMGASR
ncbi:ferrochelatase [Bowmanella sp. JS7-9]|uniref:Ferrochelatase n=1 Tax=Pseudobowmanella zhangzhouensis TaxID=1537679 RepID=A0ABW1XLB3_9ALTE|nr:ferrochelatase [Bowmanella sp. JS7-9]TBX20325.1 ferrochelatase [Bowmanella sp. JS7-9]